MNDRFESLMYHAGMTAQGCWDEMDSYQREAVEKFALLIVKECADILEPNGAYAKKYKHAHVPGPDGLRTPLSIREFINMQSAQKLREHFGVEE